MAVRYPSPPSPPSRGHAGVRALHLPPPPCERNTPKQISQIHQLLAPYYWRLHFEENPCDPASFLDRIMTDFAVHENDPVGEWIVNMSPLYKAYRACLKYGADNGTPRKALEAKRYQGVSVFLSLVDH
jgi:hypothetical protein